MVDPQYANGKENQQAENSDVIEVKCDVNKNIKTVTENLLSPPKKKFKQDAISFPKISNEEAIKETEKEAKVLKKTPTKPAEVKGDTAIPFPKVSKQEALKLTEQESKNASTEEVGKTVTQECEETPPKSKEEQVPKTPKNDQIKKKPSPLAKEEKQKAKELKEQEKIARQNELEEKRKKKEEEKLLKQVEREKREQERKEKERLREEERKKKEQEKEEERKKKEEEKKRKDEEKRIKDEQREAERLKREEEKEKKDAEKRQKDELKRLEEEKKKNEEEAETKKKEKAAQQFKSFFTKKTSRISKNLSETPQAESFRRFIPFQLKPNMSLAPVCRRKDFRKENLDKFIEIFNPDLSTYLEELAIKLANNTKILYITRRKLRRELEEKRKLIKKSNKQKESLDNLKDDDVLVISDDNTELDVTETSFCEKNLYKAKFLKFSENTRPAYFGTWNKNTKFINGRKPFRLDKDIFNYDIDSDEEWIDEPGEDCSDNGDDDDEENKEETEEDSDGFFVPHGYLSDDEGVKASDDENEEVEGEENEGHPRHSEGREEEKLRAKACSYEIEIKKLIKPRKPVCIGINYVYKMEELNPILKGYSKVDLFKPIVNDKEDNDMDVDSPNISINKTKITQPENGVNTPQTVPDEAMPFLFKLVHGSTTSLKDMRRTFQEFWTAYIKENQLDIRTFISRRQFEKTIHNTATRSHNDKLKKICYTVNDDVLLKYDIKNLPLGGGLPSLKSKTKQDIANSKQPLSLDMDVTMETDKNKSFAKLTPENCTDTPMLIDT